MRGLAAIRQANMNPLGQVLPQRGDPLQKRRSAGKRQISILRQKARSQRGYGPSDGNQDAQVVPQFPPSSAASLGQAQALDHGHVFDDGRARRGQHIARNRRRGAAQEGRSPIFRQEFTACRQADIGFGVDEAEEGNGPQDVVAREFFPSFKRRAGNGHQGVDGNGFNAEFGKADGISSRSSQVSPMPMMPPEQTQSPSF